MNLTGNTKTILGPVIVILLTISFVTLAYTTYNKILFDGNALEISPLITDFRRTFKPQQQLNFSKIYGGDGQFQILHPLLDMRKLYFPEENYSCNEEFQNRFSGFSDWLTSVKGTTSPSQNYKTQAFENFMNEGTKLPEDFLTTPPFITDFSTSYAILLTEIGPATFRNKRWVHEHLSFFKVSELAEIIKNYQIEDPIFSTISKFSDIEIEKIIKGESLVLTKNYLLLKDQSQYGFSPLGYWVYSLDDFHSFLADKKYHLSLFSPGSICLFKEGNGCWTYNSKHLMAYVSQYSRIVFLLFTLLSVGFAAFYAKRNFEKIKAQQKHRLGLQVLSHEFRTPVTAMILMMEQIAHNRLQLPEKDHDLLMRISSEIFKLQRIVEVSKTYLQTETHRINFKMVEIPSINNWIFDLAAEINSDIQCHLLKKDSSCRTDPFWLKFIISSLVQNAFTHGKPPVIIRISNIKNKVRVTVEDQGTCDFGSLSDMAEPFTKSSRSKGMGLGLNIARFITEAGGMKMLFSNNPTAFTIEIPC